LSTVGLLSAGIAHELGTPLNVIAGRARLIVDGERAQSTTTLPSSPQSAQALVKNAEIIEEQAVRIQRIVRQLPDLAPPRSPEKARIDLGPPAHDPADILAPLAEKRRVSIEVAVDAGLNVGHAADGAVVAVHGSITAVVDAAQIQQALTNLVVNAVHASREG